MVIFGRTPSSKRGTRAADEYSWLPAASSGVGWGWQADRERRDMLSPRAATARWLSQSYFPYQHLFVNSYLYQFSFLPRDSKITGSKEEWFVLAKVLILYPLLVECFINPCLERLNSYSWSHSTGPALFSVGSFPILDMPVSFIPPAFGEHWCQVLWLRGREGGCA